MSRLPSPLGASCMALGAALALACSSSSTSTTPPPSHDAGAHDASSTHHHDASHDSSMDSGAPETSVGVPDHTPDVIIDPANCVAPGATSSENGVGGYCSPGGGQCLHAGTGGTATDCSADFGAPAHEWFCTVPCTMQSDCGPGGGTCLSAPFGQVCVPLACAGNLGDAASDIVDAGDAGDAGDAAPTTDGAPHDATSADAKHDEAGHHDASGEHDTGAPADAHVDAKKD